MRPFTYDARRGSRPGAAPGPATGQGQTDAPVQYLAGGTTPDRPDEARRAAARSAWSTSTPLRARYGAIELGRRAAAGRAGADGRTRRRIRRCARLSGDRREPAARRQRAAAQHGDARRQRPAAHPLHLFPRSRAGAPATSARPVRAARRIAGFNRNHAVLGVDDSCIAQYPGDFAVALVALDAEVELSGRSGRAAHRRSRACTGRPSGRRISKPPCRQAS